MLVSQEKTDLWLVLQLLQRGHQSTEQKSEKPIKDLGAIADFGDVGETTALLRMKVIGVKQRAVRFKGFIRNTKKLVNQHRSGVINYHILIEILRRARHTMIAVLFYNCILFIFSFNAMPFLQSVQ